MRVCVLHIHRCHCNCTLQRPIVSFWSTEQSLKNIENGSIVFFCFFFFFYLAVFQMISRVTLIILSWLMEFPTGSISNLRVVG